MEEKSDDRRDDQSAVTFAYDVTTGLAAVVTLEFLMGSNLFR